MDICGTDPVYIPTTECDECDAFLSRLEVVENNVSDLADDVRDLGDNKQDKLTAGANITIDANNVISASGGGGGGSYTAGDGITISGDTISAKRNENNTYTKTEVDTALDGKQASLTATTPIVLTGNVVSHADSGVTAGAKGDATNQTPAFGDTFKVTSGTVNAKGHMTAFNEHTVKIPNAAASTTAAGLMSAADKSKLDGITIANYYTKTEADGKFVKKAGDTMTGDLGMTKATPRVTLKNTIIDAEQPDNDVSATEYTGTVMNDKNDHTLGAVHSSAQTNGNVASGIWAYNYDSDGNRIGQNSIQAIVTKTGEATYNLTEPANFRTAIRLGNEILEGTSASSASPVNVPTSTYTSVANITLNKGIYIIIGQIGYPGNNAGIRFTGLGTSVASQTTSVYSGPSPNSAQTRQQVVALFATESTVQYHLVAYQNSGSTMAVTLANIRAFKLS